MMNDRQQHYEFSRIDTQDKQQDTPSLSDMTKPKESYTQQTQQKPMGSRMKAVLLHPPDQTSEPPKTKQIAALLRPFPLS